MFTLVVVLLIIVSLLLCLVVLVQNSKGGGLASGFSASNQIMGVRKTTDFLEKLTWGFAIGMLVLAMIGNFVLPRNASSTGETSVIEEQMSNSTMPSAAPAPTPAPAAEPAPAPAAQPAP
ncbi:MAG: preprotein translocase subunit SecG [Bacteroidota bacterium]